MNVAFIPVRGGSKSIPLKNIKMLADKPLVYWTVKAACGCRFIDRVYVATEDLRIRKTVLDFKKDQELEGRCKLEVVERSWESASDTAATESVMLEFAERYAFDSIVLIQATSPLLESTDLDNGFASYGKNGVDSVLSVVRQKRFLWAVDENGISSPLNYDVFRRPRRQEFEGYLVENGAFYITSKERLLESKNRISGNIAAVEMGEDSFFEIDEPTDWMIVEKLISKKKQGRKKIAEIKMVLTDCDGCLTDGGMYYSEQGDELKKFHARDGMGVEILRARGVAVGIITGEDMRLNKKRAEKLGLEILEAGCKNKLEAIKKHCREHGITLENVCYVGDDINDVDALRAVGFACCPQDAMPQVKEAVRFCASAKGGEGVFREVAEHLLEIGAVK